MSSTTNNKRSSLVSARILRIAAAAPTGAAWFGGFAAEAMSVGALALGRVATGKLAAGQVKVKKFTVGELEVDTLRVRKLEITEE